MDLGEVVKSIETKANVDLSVFREPRGVARVLQFIIGALAAIAIYGFEGIITIYYTCGKEEAISYIPYSYPFQLTQIQGQITCTGVTTKFQLALNDGFSQYAEYFSYVCVLSIIYSCVAMIFYAKCTATYESVNNYPLMDFIATVIVAVLWMFTSAAWTHGLSGLKSTTNPSIIINELQKKNTTSLVFNKAATSTYFGLNVSAMLGCLSFFLWATDLWFLYKETPWFRGRRAEAVGSPA